ncbi:hypothetical protein [Solidesulfovibrio sp. C21]|uniref:hypothetical protein n=1 Tax=Solidesulfovibrio sp. C21 TaxID=3398613 RepID=UPI0039FBD451
MNTDIRLSTEFWDHPKTVKLERRLGLQGPKSLQILWMWTAKNHPDGRLEGEDVEGIEIAAKWPGNESTFVETLVSLRWLDQDGDTFCLHDWREHNAWAAEADSRSDKSRLSRMAKTHPDLYARLIKEGKQGVSRDEYESLTTVERPLNGRKRTLQAQGPSPSPAPMAEEIKKPPYPPEGGEAGVALPSSREDDPDAQPNANVSDLNECLIEFQEIAAVFQEAGGYVDTVPAYNVFLPMRFRFPRDRVVDDITARGQSDAWKRMDVPMNLSTYLGKKKWLDPIPKPRERTRASPASTNLTPRQQQTEMFKGMARALKQADGAENGENYGGRRVEGALPAGAALPRS